MLRSTKVLFCTLLRRAVNGTATGNELNTLALMTDAGSVLPPNRTRALIFLRAAAIAHNHECAVATLAAVSQSLHWWRVAATFNNNAWAQTIVGDAYAASGNFVHAVRWWWRAWKNGDVAARNRFICLAPVTNHNSSLSHKLYSLPTVDIQVCVPKIMEVELPQLAVLWSVYFESMRSESSETTEATTDTQLDVYVSRKIKNNAVAAHVMPLLKSLELYPNDESASVATLSWVAAPTTDTAVVSVEFTDAFSRVHTVSSEVGALVHLEGELRKVPGHDFSELWFCATFDSDVVAPNVFNGVSSESSIKGVLEWAQSAPHLNV